MLIFRTIHGNIKIDDICSNQQMKKKCYYFTFSNMSVVVKKCLILYLQEILRISTAYEISSCQLNFLLYQKLNKKFTNSRFGVRKALSYPSLLGHIKYRKAEYSCVICYVMCLFYTQCAVITSAVNNTMFYRTAIG